MRIIVIILIVKSIQEDTMQLIGCFPMQNYKIHKSYKGMAFSRWEEYKYNSIKLFTVSRKS